MKLSFLFLTLFFLFPFSSCTDNELDDFQREEELPIDELPPSPTPF